MTSGRLSNTENLPLFGAALVAMYAIYAALTRLPRRLARWVRGVFTAPLHKAPRGHAEQHERVPSPVFRSAFADRAGHETYTFGPKDLSGVHAALCACGRLAGHNGECDPVPAPPLAPLPDEPEPYETDDAFIESARHLLPSAALLTDEELAEIKARFLAAIKSGAPPVWLPPDGMEITGKDGKPFPVLEPATKPAIHLEVAPEPATPVAVLQETELHPAIAADLNGHTSTGDALDSMLQRALSPELLARLDAQKDRDGSATQVGPGLHWPTTIE